MHEPRSDSKYSSGSDRRAFIKTVAGAAVGALGGLVVPKVFAVPSETPDLVLKNGLIITMDPRKPIAQALAVRNGRLTVVGTNEEVATSIGRETKVVDLQGDCVGPGIIDAHSHLMGYGQMELMYVIIRPPKVNSFSSLNKVLAKAAADRPQGQWIVGRGFKNFKEGRFPRRQHLDEAVPDHPVLIIHWSGQFGVANTMALKKANLFKKDLKDPYGGKYLREKNGLPDGVLIHYPAIYSVYKPPMSDSEQLECTKWAVEQFAKEGVTCVHDNFVVPRRAVKYVQLERAGSLPLRLRVYPYVWNVKHCRLLVNRMRRYEGPLVRVQGIKLAADGYPLMYKPLVRSHTRFVKPMHPQGRLEEIISMIHKAELQADVHAVGDKAVDWTLAAFRKAAGSDSGVGDYRHRIEHFPFRRRKSIRRAAELGVPVCIQPEMITVRGDDFLKRIGRDLTYSMLPAATFAAEGVMVSFGADVPAFPSHRPLDSIRNAMIRKTASGVKLDPRESVSFLEAMKMHTINAAYAAFDEKELGSLEKGKYADFVIWNKDLREIKSESDLRDLKAKATYMGGHKTYSRDT